jgi:hypothetical protein
LQHTVVQYSVIDHPCCSQELEASYDPGKPLTFKIEFDTVPPVTWKRSYKDIEITVK